MTAESARPGVVTRAIIRGLALLALAISAPAPRTPLVVWRGCREAPPYPDLTDKQNEPFCVFPRP